MTTIRRPLRTSSDRPPGSVTPLVTVTVLVGVFCTAIGIGQAVGLPDLAGSWSRSHSDGLRRSIPTSVAIPALGVQADVVEVGRAADGSIATPVGDPVRQAGWYGRGPAPGEQGTAVIVGHVDTRTEPAVFATIAGLGQGKLIEVDRQDGRVATFAVESVERFPKTAFPIDRIFDRDDRPRLVLVTCGGAWVGAEIGYADNVIVFATMV
jgi:hypothetical protein